MPGLTIPKSNSFTIQPRDVDGKNVGKPITLTFDQVKKRYPKQAEYYDLDSDKGRRDFRHNVRKKLNWEYSPEFNKKRDNERKRKKRLEDPETPRKHERASKKKAAIALKKKTTLEQDLAKQNRAIGKSFGSYLKDSVKTGYKKWLEYNPQAVRTLADGTPLSPRKQYELWWKLLPDYQKETIEEEYKKIYDYNKRVRIKYRNEGKVAPKAVLEQGHHLLPLSRGGGQVGANITRLRGDVWENPNSPHASVHRADLDPRYRAVQEMGYDTLPFNPDDPNLQGDRGRRFLNMLGDIGGGGTGGNIMNFIKPATKTALRAVPFLGASMGVKAADDYRRSGQNKLAAMAAMSALPGPLGWLGLGGEMGGLLWNKVTEDPNFLHRGILDDDQKRWTYTGHGRKRG